MPSYVDASKNYSIYIKELKKKRGVKGKKKRRGGTFRFEAQYGSGGASYPESGGLGAGGHGGSGGGGGGHSGSGGGGY